MVIFSDTWIFGKNNIFKFHDRQKIDNFYLEIPVFEYFLLNRSKQKIIRYSLQ
ncbi:MAG: hypothetical protein QOG58_3151 [Caballeronia sp.]|nr:hypothetical protein [Caballeronia sp.]